MEQRDWELLDQQMRGLSPPRGSAVILTGAVAFFLGLALGGFVYAHESERVTLASYQSSPATLVSNGAPSQTMQYHNGDRGPWF